MNLDDLGRRSANAVHAAVSEVAVPAFPARRGGLGLQRAVLAGATAGVLVLGATIFLPAPAPPSVDQPLTPAPTSLAVVSTPALPSTTLAPVITQPADVTPPHLEVTSPEDGARVTKVKVKVIGLTETGVTLYVAGKLTEVGGNGDFERTLTLDKGKNTIDLVAEDAAGNRTQLTLIVVYQPPAATTTTKPPAETTTTKPEVAEFKAFATYGTCDSEPPYDIYYGKGQPGSTVTVSSEFGSRETTVDEEGKWQVQVFFPEAPLGEGFQVLVSDSLGREKAFEFTYLG